MKIFSYLDTVVESTERIDKARGNLNKTIVFVFIVWLFMMSFSLILYIIDYKISATWIGLFAISYLVLLACLVIKREIFSIAILIKKTMEEK